MNEEKGEDTNARYPVEIIRPHADAATIDHRRIIFSRGLTCQRELREISREQGKLVRNQQHAQDNEHDARSDLHDMQPFLKALDS
jgi:hypothetical protein